MDISRTIPKTESQSWVNNMFNGTWTQEDYFPLGKTVKYAFAGDHFYLIYKNRYAGRFEITKVDQSPQTLPVGTANTPVLAKTTIWVKLPGEPAPPGLPQVKGHRNARYLQ